MSYKKPEQIESGLSPLFENEEKPWKGRRHTSVGRKFTKRAIHKSERQRKRLEVECDPRYNKYHGFEY